MSNADEKKAPTTEEILRRLLNTPPAPFTPKAQPKPAKKSKANKTKS